VITTNIVLAAVNADNTATAIHTGVKEVGGTGASSVAIDQTLLSKPFKSAKLTRELAGKYT
jgi:hypothetical protein